MVAADAVEERPAGATEPAEPADAEGPAAAPPKIAFCATGAAVPAAGVAGACMLGVADVAGAAGMDAAVDTAASAP